MSAVHLQLWEKEGLLEYQEERLMNSEDLELEMANYINEMAQMLLKANQTLPSGLEEKPYYGSQLTNVDDDPAQVRRTLTHAVFPPAVVRLPVLNCCPRDQAHSRVYHMHSIGRVRGRGRGP